MPTLWSHLIMPARSYLGASMDGIIRNHKHHNEDGPGVLEIECPFSINKTPVTRRNSGDLAKEYSNFWSIKRVDCL